MQRLMEAGKGSLAFSEELAWSICDLAANYWKESPEDFCLQTIGDNGVLVFGSVNRVQWTPGNGFICFQDSCTPDFIDHFKEIDELNDDGSKTVLRIV